MLYFKVYLTNLNFYKKKEMQKMNRYQEKMLLNSLYNDITKTMKINKITYAKLSKKTGKKYSVIYNAINDQSNVKFLTLMTILKALNLHFKLTKI